MLVQPFVAVYLEVAEVPGSPYGLRDFYSFLKMLRAGIYSPTHKTRNEVSTVLPPIINCEVTVSILLVYVIQRNFGSVKERDSSAEQTLLSSDELKIHERLRNIARQVKDQLDQEEAVARANRPAATTSTPMDVDGVEHQMPMTIPRPAEQRNQSSAAPRVQRDGNYCARLGQRKLTNAYTDPEDFEKQIWIECDESSHLEVYALYKGARKLYHPELNNFYFGRATLDEDEFRSGQMGAAVYAVVKSDRPGAGGYQLLAQTKKKLLQNQGISSGTTATVTYNIQEIVDYLAVERRVMKPAGSRTGQRWWGSSRTLNFVDEATGEATSSMPPQGGPFSVNFRHETTGELLEVTFAGGPPSRAGGDGRPYPGETTVELELGPLSQPLLVGSPIASGPNGPQPAAATGPRKNWTYDELEKHILGRSQAEFRALFEEREIARQTELGRRIRQQREGATCVQSWFSSCFAMFFNRVQLPVINTYNQACRRRLHEQRRGDYRVVDYDRSLRETGEVHWYEAIIVRSLSTSPRTSLSSVRRGASYISLTRIP